MNKLVLAVVAAVFVVSLTGCSRPEQVVSSDPVCLPQVDLDRAMKTARTVLEDMQFTIDKYDPDALYIRTRPLSGAQFFQFWRGDNASAYTSARANLQSLRRFVEIEAMPYPTRTCLECRVTVQKLSLPEDPVRGASRMGGTYTESSDTEQSLRIEPAQLEQMEWLDAGPDRELEQKILTKIRENVSL